MEKQLLIHRNLSTSFVNLAALLRHLRRLQFVGTISVELSSYDAEIELLSSGAIRAVERDYSDGRVEIGDGALQRILIRAREAGGLIQVYRAGEVNRVFIDRKIVAGANRMLNGKFDTHVSNFEGVNPSEPTIMKMNVPESPENWSELLSIMTELLRTLDDSLSSANIEFSDAFQTACGFASFNHPFLDPETDVVTYRDGYISVRSKVSNQELSDGLVEAISHIMDRLREDQQFGKLHHSTLHKLRVLANRRRPQFEKFALKENLQLSLGL